MKGAIDMSKKGIDISTWNKINDYSAMKKAGVEFAVLKVNNAGSAPDRRFAEHAAGCRSAGIPVIGGYSYCYATSVEKARIAADGFVQIAKPKGVDAMVLDLEDASIMGLGHKIADIINVYRDFATAAKMKFIIYTGGHFYNPCLKPFAKEIKDIPIWWARYPSTDNRKITDPIPLTKYLPKDLPLCGWQYSSTGVIPGAQGYVDLNVWYDDVPAVNAEREITAQYNPFTEPISNVRLGTLGNDANWVQWYLWRFGKYVDAKGQPDQTKVCGVIGVEEVQKIKEVQALLGLTADGIVGKATRSVWKKIC